MSTPKQGVPRYVRLCLFAHRRWLWIGIAGLCLVAIGLAVWRLGWTGERRDRVWERIQRDGVIRVAMDASYPPFESVNEAGEFAGYDADLAWELARRLGIPHVALINIHFDGLYDALLDAKCDIILSALPYDSMLTQDVAYSAAYFQAGQMLVVRAGEREIVGPGDLGGKRVAFELGSEAHYVGRQLMSRKGIALVQVTTYTAEEALDLLGSASADAAIVDAVTAYSYLGRHDDVRVTGAPLSDEPYVIAVPPDSPVLLDRINHALAGLREEGFLDQLRAKWF